MRQMWFWSALATVLVLGRPVTWARQDTDLQELQALHRRAGALEKAGKFAEAIRARQTMVEKAEKRFGPNHANTAGVLSHLGLLYRRLGLYPKAEAPLKRSLQIVENSPAMRRSLPDALSNLGGFYKATGQYRKAEKLYQRALKLREDDLGKDHLDTALSLHSLAGLCQDQGEYARAEELYRRVLRIREIKLGKKDLLVARTLNDLGSLYVDRGLSEKATPLFQSSLEITIEHRGNDHPDLVAPLGWLADVAQYLGEHDKAEQGYVRCLKILERHRGKNHPSVATALHNLASFYQHLGQSARAEPLYRRSLQIRQERLGKNHPDVATSLNNLAELYKTAGQRDRAEKLYRLSLKILEDRFGGDHPLVAASRYNLAGLCKDAGRRREAETLYQKALESWEARLGKDHPDVARALNGLGLLCHDQLQHARAEAFYLRSLAIFEGRLGKHHPLLGGPLNNLALLYQDTGRYQKAQELYRRAQKIQQATLGEHHFNLALSSNNLALLLARTGEARQAAGEFDRARRIARRHLAAVLPALAESEKAAFFLNTSARRDLAMALSLGLEHSKDNSVAALAASWLVNARAVDQEGLASSLLLARESSDAGVGKLSRQLLSVRQRLARLTLSRPRPGREKQHLEQVEKLTTQEQELGKALRQAGSKAAPPSWVELGDVRKALPADAVLIDVAHFRPFNFTAKPGQKKWQAARYAAWVTPRSGAVQIVDLGPAEQIDGAVKRFREAIKAAAELVKGQGEEKAEQALREHLDTLSKRVLQPLLPHVGKSKKWLISPDGNLWLLPWEALTLKDGKYAIEKYRISYLTSGRDVIPTVAAKVKVQAPLVLADPDFDLDKKQAQTNLPATAPGEDDTSSLSAAFRLGRAKRLPFTAAEARAVTPSLKAYARMTPRVHLRSEALEGVFKAVQNPRVLVLSTHGFFLPDQEVARAEESRPGKSKPVKKWDNPLLRCGLLLAGCNNAAKATNADDGVLTGLEVVGTDLRGCELVVLSACETGVGEVQSGEGVSGLRQAFQLAGVQAVVSTLWQVPDKSSARLMSQFFKNLSLGMNKAEALRAAKLTLIEERRDDYAAAHPFFWAAFTLTGR